MDCATRKLELVSDIFWMIVDWKILRIYMRTKCIRVCNANAQNKIIWAYFLGKNIDNLNIQISRENWLLRMLPNQIFREYRLWQIWQKYTKSEQFSSRKVLPLKYNLISKCYLGAKPRKCHAVKNAKNFGTH